jgi:hypothetical protein
LDVAPKVLRRFSVAASRLLPGKRPEGSEGERGPEERPDLRSPVHHHVPQSIAAYLLFQSVLDDPSGYIAGGGKDNQIYPGVLLELLLIIANVGTAVVPYPIARRQNEALALGYVAARIIECVFLAAGIIFVLGVVSLRRDSPDAADLAVSLAALKDRTFLFGPGFVVPWGNGLILGYLMYKSGLVPRRMAWLGLIGGPLLRISSIGTIVDWWGTGGTVPGLLVIPEFIWEAFLGIYCAIWGFRRDSPILSIGSGHRD